MVAPESQALVDEKSDEDENGNPEGQDDGWPSQKGHPDKFHSRLAPLQMDGAFRSAVSKANGESSATNPKSKVKGISELKQDKAKSAGGARPESKQDD